MTDDKIYQLRIQLIDVEPTVWRTVEVRSDIKLQQLHEAIQAAMGWENYHLFQFSHGKTRILSDVMKKENDWVHYQYDFGDSWEHAIILQKVIPAESKVAYPRCIAGENACPPEDCGGFPGYDRLCKIMKQPKHKEHKEMLEWLGLTSAKEFNPKAFDIAEANARLKRLQRKPKKKAA